MTNVASAAANSPVYKKKYVCRFSDDSSRESTYKDEYPVSTRVPPFGLLSVMFLRMRQV